MESVIARLTANVGGSLYENNVHTYRLITEGFAIKREDTSKADLCIEQIDFNTERNNIIRIVNQLEIKGLEKRIPDGIIYINGLPMVVLVFKSAVKEETTIKDTYTQLTVRYRRDIPELFQYNAFVVISDGVNSKYGSLFTPYDFFYAWRKVEATDKATDGVSSLLTMVQGLFRKDRLLSVIKDFVFLHDSLPNATYVGFTGTPIDATIDVFGDVVDAYTMTESVADDITRRIQRGIKTIDSRNLRYQG